MPWAWAQVCSGDRGLWTGDRGTSLALAGSSQFAKAIGDNLSWVLQHLGLGLGRSLGLHIFFLFLLLYFMCVCVCVMPFFASHRVTVSLASVAQWKLNRGLAIEIQLQGWPRFQWLWLRVQVWIVWVCGAVVVIEYNVAHVLAAHLHELPIWVRCELVEFSSSRAWKQFSVDSDSDSAKQVRVFECFYDIHLISICRRLGT